MKIKLFTFLLFAIFFLNNSYAQKVGVVLSGGGAKGLYHIGILKALEENDIPIDYISGTSMGAIVGGLYAAGYSPWEIEQILTGPEISSWVSGKLDQKYAYFYNHLPEKPEMVNYDIDINQFISTLRWQKELKKTDKIPVYYDENRNTSMPANLVASTQLDIGLMEYFSGANAIAKSNFDSLYIPFRCVSVDAVTKTERLWKDGDLSLAIRASMAIPIVFSPVIIDSTVMFDGSVLNNFPWEESYELWEPELMIGGRCVAGDVLDVSSPMGQGMALMFSPTDYNMPDSIGIMVGRAVDVGPLDFSNAKQIIDYGYEDAMKAMPEIIKRAPRTITKKQRNRKRLEFKRRIPELIFDKQQVENELVFDMLLTDSTNVQEVKRVIKDSIKLEKVIKKLEKKGNKTSEIMNMDELLHQYYSVITEGSAVANFPYANYIDSLGIFDFDVKLDRNPILSIRAGLNISSSSINQGYLGLAYRRSKRISSFYNVDGYIGAFYNSGQASMRYNFYGSKKNIYLYNTATYNHINFSRANNQKFAFAANNSNNTLSEFYGSSLLGMPIGINTKVELRAALGVDRFNYGETEADVANEAVRLGSTVGFGSLNATISSYTLNNTYYPTKGTSQQFSASVMYGYESLRWKNSPSPNPNRQVFTAKTWWASIRYSRMQFFELSKRFSLGYSAEGVLSIAPKLSEHASRYMAPRFMPTQLLSTMFIPEFQSYSYLAAGIIPVYKVFDKMEVRMESYIYYNDLLNPHIENFNYVISAIAMYKLPFASISLVYSRLGVDSVKKDYFIFNFGVMMFNPRGVIY